jgi:outer membrane beta-barrel protein
MNKKKKNLLRQMTLVAIFLLSLSGYAFGADYYQGANSSVIPNSGGMPAAAGTSGMPTASSNPTNSSVITPSVGRVGEAKKIDVDPLKKAYWKGDYKANPSVVTNRAYQKSGRLNLGVTGGFVNDDPFLNTYSVGGLIGYNFSEFISVNLIYWRMINTNSSAYAALVQVQGVGSNSNPLSSVAGGEIAWSLLYGKLSLLGAAILHYDMYVFGGAGAVFSQNGTYIAPWVGIGQQIFLTNFMSLTADYRVMVFQENIVELFKPATLGQVIGTRLNFSTSATLGLRFFLF